MKKPWFTIHNTNGFLTVSATKKKRLTTIQRIDMSIEKFQALYDAVKEDKWVRDVQVYEDTCPLCWKFVGGGCLDCPIRQMTGIGQCLGTPYYKIVFAGQRHKLPSALRAEIKYLQEVRVWYLEQNK